MLFMKKNFGKIKIALNILVTIMVVSFLLVVCLQRFSNNEISLFNFRMFTVASGSMAPQYNVGDVLIAKETEPEDVKVGDSVTYLGVYGSFANKVVTHEVTSIEKKDGEFIFHTKGIANLVEDPPVHEDQLYGVIVWRPIILSLVYKIVGTKFGMFIFVILPIFYIIGSEILASMLEREEERRNKLKGEDEDKDDSSSDKEDKVKEEKLEKEEKSLKEEIDEKTKKQVKKKSTKKTEDSEVSKETKEKTPSKKKETNSKSKKTTEEKEIKTEKVKTVSEGTKKTSTKKKSTTKKDK